ncbi:MAG: hypothetical protein LBQ76_05180 [Candidatus Fibromonas sp.]|jgi:hypothetical protein|nr:hypothetical protein [Candidatus Fibromonas sp.]
MRRFVANGRCLQRPYGGGGHRKMGEFRGKKGKNYRKNANFRRKTGQMAWQKGQTRRFAPTDPANFFYIYPQMQPQTCKLPLTLDPLTQALGRFAFRGKNLPKKLGLRFHGLCSPKIRHFTPPPPPPPQQEAGKTSSLELSCTQETTTQNNLVLSRWQETTFHCYLLLSCIQETAFQNHLGGSCTQETVFQSNLRLSCTRETVFQSNLWPSCTQETIIPSRLLGERICFYQNKENNL